MFTLLLRQVSENRYFIWILLFQLLPIGLLAASTETIELGGVAIMVQGTVTDKETGEPLPGVNILIKGTGIGTATDIDGKYALNVPEGNGILVFSFIGYVTQEVALNNRTTIDIQLSGDFNALNEVVVTGYSSER